MNFPRLSALVLLIGAGCTSNPKPVITESPLAIGDCVVLENTHRDSFKLRQTIDVEGCIAAPLLGKVKVAGKNPKVAEQSLESEYLRRKLFNRIDLVLLRCDE